VRWGQIGVLFSSTEKNACPPPHQSAGTSKALAAKVEPLEVPLPLGLERKKPSDCHSWGGVGVGVYVVPLV
jgi:hypothetical protein